jgi:hypothetical protein
MDKDKDKDKEKDPQYLLQDALREVTRKERRNLLAVACVGTIIVWSKVDLSTLSVLGCKLDLQTIPNNGLLVYLGAVVIYFWIAFFIYSISDLIAWGFAVADTRTKQEEERHQSELEQQQQRDDKAETAKKERSKVYGEEFRAIMANHQRATRSYERVQEAKDKRQSYYLPSKIISLLRITFDIGFPLVVGGYAIWLLMFP